MENNEHRKASSAIIESLAKILHEKIGIPVYVMDPIICESLLEYCKENREISDKFTERELRDEVSYFISKITLFDKPKNEDELEKKFNIFMEGLKKEKEYEAYLLLRDLLDFPVGLKIGALEIVDEVKDKKEVLSHIEYLKKKDLVYTEGRSWGLVKFNSFRTQGVSEKLYDILELPFGILSLVMDFDLDVKDACGAIYSKEGRIYLLSPNTQPRGWTKYLEKAHKKYFDLISDVCNKNKKSKLEQKIVQSIRIYWLSRISEKIEIRFLLTMSSLESLLLTKYDRDYIGLKLSEKAAFLLERDLDKRIALYKIMKKYYEKRSDLIHSGQSNINEIDERTLNSIYQSLVFNLLELGRKYSKMEQKSHEKDEAGIEDYINEMKFA